jgi:hypothetical protein
MVEVYKNKLKVNPFFPILNNFPTVSETGGKPIFPFKHSIPDNKLSAKNPREIETDLPFFVEQYSKCIDSVLTFPLAHEIAHIYLSKDINNLHGIGEKDEFEADCWAQRHIKYSVGRDVDYGALLENVIIKALTSPDPKYITGTKADLKQLSERLNALKSGRCD